MTKPVHASHNPTRRGPPSIDQRAARLAAAADPAPAAVERGPVARVHWRHGLDVDPALAGAVVDHPDAPAELPALLAECHADLLDPRGVRPLERPSPLGREVRAALHGHDAWATLRDAAQAHPMIAREAVCSLADVVRDACRRAGARAGDDTRASLADLERARERVRLATQAERDARAARDPTALREATREAIAAREAQERAEGAHARAEGIAARAGEAVEDAGLAVANIAAAATERADAAHAYAAAVGSGTGVGGVLPVPDDVVKALTPEVVAVLKRIGALRRALAAGRASRHVRGYEGIIGIGDGGIDRAADLTPLALASLGGYLGPHHAALTQLDLVRGQAPVVERGGGPAREGHVLLVVDQSGSTHGAPAVWIAALALTILLEARQDGRVSGLVCFDDGVSYADVVDSPASVAAALKALCSPGYGGTDVRGALGAAEALLGRMPMSGDPADVVLITDGVWDAADAAGFPDRARLAAVFVGGGAPPAADAVLSRAWEVRAVEGADADALAVEIAASIV